MATLAIRQSGGANIVSIPKSILQTLGLDVGSKLDLTIEEGHIVLKPVSETLTLETVLQNSPKERLQITEEDRTWLDDGPVGKEVW